MESNDSECNIGASNKVTMQAGLAYGIPGYVCLLLSVIGLAEEFLFVCRKKNNFLLRLFIYLTVAVIISQALFSLFLLVYMDPLKYGGVFCAVLDGLLNYPTLVEFLFKISINVVLLYKVYVSTCYRSRQRWYPKYPKTFECILVFLNFVVPLAVTAAILGSAGSPKYWASADECQITYTDIAECENSKGVEEGLKLITEFIPALVEFVLSVITIGTLLLWISWLQSKNFLQARMRTVVREIGPLLGFLIAYCSLRLILEILNIPFSGIAEKLEKKNPIDKTTVMLATYAIYPINHASPPISFLVYICIVSLCKSRKRARRPYSTEVKTTPSSNRVSLPSDTAAHALNFLSPSTAAESSLREREPLLLN